MTFRAVLMLVTGVILFAVMDGLSKLLTGTYPILQLVWARYAFAVPVVLAATRPTAWPGPLRCERPMLQIGRSLLPVVANTTAVAGLARMPLADATAISFISPLLVVALAVPLLGERVAVRSWIGVAFGFMGTLIIIRPGAGAFASAAVFPLTTAFVFALYQVLTRLVGRNDRPVVTLAWTILVGLVATSIPLASFWQPVHWSDWWVLALSGVLFGFGQFLLIGAFATAPAALLAPFSYVQILAAVLFGMAVFGEVPDLWTVTGAGVVVLAGVYALRRQAT